MDTTELGTWNPAYNMYESPLFEPMTMEFCWNCGKLYSRDYIKSHYICLKNDSQCAKSKMPGGR